MKVFGAMMVVTYLAFKCCQQIFHIPLEPAECLHRSRLLVFTDIERTTDRKRVPHRRQGRAQAGPSEFYALTVADPVHAPHFEEPRVLDIAIYVPCQHVQHSGSQGCTHYG